jgi:hypothetical protein
MKSAFIAAVAAFVLLMATDLHAMGQGCLFGDKECRARSPKFPPRDQNAPNGRAPNGCLFGDKECRARLPKLPPKDQNASNGRAPNGCLFGDKECRARLPKF